MIQLLQRSAVVLLLATLAPAATADVITVGAAGDYTDIQPAVNAAAQGDVILVSGGAYLGVEIFDKALTIVADTAAAVEVTGTVTVQQLSTDRTVTLDGLDITSGLSSKPGLHLLDNTGAVRVQDCNIRGMTSFFSGSSLGAMVDNSADVGFRDCTISGGWQVGTPIGFPPPSTEGVFAQGPSTTIAFHGCTVNGGRGSGTLPIGAGGGDGGTALRIQAARVFASGTAFNGGMGAGGEGCDEFTPSGDGGPGGTAVTIQGAPSITWFRHQDSTLTGGVGGPGGPPNIFFCNDQGADGADGVALSDPAGVASSIQGTAHSLDAPSPVRELEPFAMSLVGDVLDAAVVLVSPAPDSSWQPDANGQFLLAGPFQLYFVGHVPGSGSIDLITEFPELGPAIDSVTLYTQPLFLGTGGVLTLGAPFVAVVLDGAF